MRLKPSNNCYFRKPLKPSNNCYFRKPLNKEELKKVIIELREELPFIENMFGISSASACIIRINLKTYTDSLLYRFNAKVVKDELVEIDAK